MLQLLTLVYLRRDKYKLALRSLHQAQNIVAVLDETVPRTCDYVVAVNSLTAFVLLKLEKPLEALDFITIAEIHHEKTLIRLLDAQQ